MSTIQMGSNGFGGVIQGNFGTYQANSDGSFTVDTRDVSTLLALGFTYMNKNTTAYTTTKPPAAASATAIVASTALSNGTVAVTANPDVLRQVELIVGAGTLAITAGSLAATYIGNDGVPGTDTLSLSCPASATVTQYLTRGVDTITSLVVSGLVGGASPFLEMGTTTTISVPVGPSAVDISFEREYDSSATIAVGTPSSVTVASIAPTTTPNGTVTYSFVYSYVTPDV
jgi:hypothetical protein